MDSPRDITTAIRGFLANQGSSASAPIGEVAAIYADYCRQANDRLRRCGAYLQQGRRTEAIHLAELSPDLLERVNDLDLIEFAEWVGVCDSNGFEAPPRLMTEVAGQLNEAYSLEQELAPLLRKQRAMALAGSPLVQRLDVQRALVKADPNHPTWEEDLRSYEQARLRELINEAQAAYDAADPNTLFAILRELLESPWRVEVPTEQIEGVRRQAREVQVATATQVLHTLMPRLDEAYIAMAEDEAAALVKRWRTIVRDNQLEVPEELRGRFEPIAKWLSSLAATEALERDFAEACGTLRVAIESDVPLVELESLYAATQSYDQPLPEDLEDLYRQSVNERRLAESRRRTVGYVLATPIVIAALAAIGWFVNLQIDTHQATVKAEELRELLDQGEVQRAAQLVEEIPSRLLTYQPLKDERFNLDRAIEKQTVDRARLASLLETLEAAVTAQQPVNAEWITTVNQQLVEARSLSGSVNDREMTKRLAYLGQSISPLITSWQASVDGQFQDRLQTWATEEFQALDTEQLDTDLSAYAKAVERLKRELNVLSLTPNVSSEALAATAYYREALTQAEQAVAERRTMQTEQRQADTALAAALEVAGVPSRYVQRLEAAAQVQPDVGRAAAFAQATQLVKYWDAVQRWEARLHEWDGQVFPDTFDELNDRLESMRRFRDNQPAAFELPGEEMLWEALRAAERSLSSRGVWHGGYADYLRSTPAISELCVMSDRSGKVYYTSCDASFARVAGGLSGPIYSGLDLSSTQRRTIDAPPNVTEPQRSPQSILADDQLAILGELDGSNWRDIGLRLADLIQSRSAVDSVLRVAMLDRVLETIARVTPEVDEIVMPLRDAIVTLNVLDADWIEPDNAEANAARTRSTAFLAGLELTPLRNKLHRMTDQLQAELGYEPAGYGIALMEHGEWKIMTRLPPREGVTARVVVTQPADGGAELRQIGVAHGGAFEIAAPSMVGVPEGSLVFLWRPVNASASVSRSARMNRELP